MRNVLWRVFKHYYSYNFEALATRSTPSCTVLANSFPVRTDQSLPLTSALPLDAHGVSTSYSISSLASKSGACRWIAWSRLASILSLRAQLGAVVV